jgi:hypothetical protein
MTCVSLGKALAENTVVDEVLPVSISLISVQSISN